MVRKVEAFALDHDLKVVDSSQTRRCVVLRGPAGAVSEAFGVRLCLFDHEDGRHRGFEGAVRLPEELADGVQAVLGLENRPVARPLFAPTAPTGKEGVPGGALKASQLAQAYQLPDHADGTGETVGILTMAGGYLREDLEAFVAAEGLPIPEVVDFEVHSGGAGSEVGRNDPAPQKELDELSAVLDGKAALSPSAGAMATYETSMDVQLAGAFAPGARIVVYFAPSNSEHGLYHALAAAIHDPKHRPSVLSLSWGWSEAIQTRGGTTASPIARAIDDLLKVAASMGVTVCIASGDSGSEDENGETWVQFPASSPYALGCGGTSLELLNGRLVEEKAWNATFLGQKFASGGGFSRLFERPRWQRGPGVPEKSTGRGVPDVCAGADRATGCGFLVGGHWELSAGTSAVAPLWAALVARLNQALGNPVGFLNPWLYFAKEQDPEILRDVVGGSNGDFQATIGWDPVTGLGSPDGRRLLSALAKAASEIEPPAEEKAAQADPPTAELVAVGGGKG
jgi:kumamolisin